MEWSDLHRLLAGDATNAPGPKCYSPCPTFAAVRGVSAPPPLRQGAIHRTTRSPSRLQTPLAAHFLSFTDAGVPEQAVTGSPPSQKLCFRNLLMSIPRGWRATFPVPHTAEALFKSSMPPHPTPESAGVPARTGRQTPQILNMMIVDWFGSPQPQEEAGPRQAL
ncbi:transcription initiation factor TFIID subunit 12 isoform X3 [Molothrus ater]|uniref:transcription initiation factor TFIID subunit 12 isoform X3 n=1 Tax=Molothrus ater TaxID=84834 RepID=UPI0023E827F6|nr:transcription initiation factor TFIID subunit 12 isoform X3 [Molothrus ater]